MTAGDSPKVCVIIAAYNAQGTIARAVASALAEPEVSEVLVIDDASSDQTIATARSVDDGSGRLSVVGQIKNTGPSAARNLAIAQGRAPWIAILDADDFFLPGRLKAMLAYVGEADLIADDLLQVDEANIDGPKKNLMGWLSAPKQVSFQEFVVSNVTKPGVERKELGFIKPVISRKFLDAHKLRYQESMRLGEDFELYARALGLGARLLLIPNAGYVSVVRENSLSGQHSIADLRNLRDCGNALKGLNLSAGDREALREHYTSVNCRMQWRKLIFAVKTHDFSAGVKTFLRSWAVTAYLLKQLGHQAYVRTIGKKA